MFSKAHLDTVVPTRACREIFSSTLCTEYKKLKPTSCIRMAMLYISMGLSICKVISDLLSISNISEPTDQIRIRYRHISKLIQWLKKLTSTKNQPTYNSTNDFQSHKTHNNPVSIMSNDTHHTCQPSPRK